MTIFQVICLNKNGDSVSVFRIQAVSLAEAKKSVLTRFSFLGAPAGAKTFRVVELH